MTINHFQPTVWTSKILKKLNELVVLANPTIINRDYENEIEDKGVAVKVTSLVDPDVHSGYDKTRDLDVDELTDDEAYMVIDQGDYYNLRVNDLDKKQSSINYVNEATERVANELSMLVEKHIARRISSGALTDNKVQINVGSDYTNVEAVYQGLTEAWAKLLQNNKNQVLRPWAVLPIWAIQRLLNDKVFKEQSFGTVVRQGAVGNILGFDIFQSTNTLRMAGFTEGYVGADNKGLSFADQLVKNEALRDPNRFGDRLRGLHVYGSKVFRPERLGVIEFSGTNFGGGTDTNVITGDMNFGAPGHVGLANPEGLLFDAAGGDAGVAVAPKKTS